MICQGVPCNNPNVASVQMPLQFTEHMQTIWQNAFQKQIRARYKQRFNPHDPSISAEAAAWEALVCHFGKNAHCSECGTVQEQAA